MSEKTNRVFEEYVPKFEQYVKENSNLPTGAEFDKTPGSPNDDSNESEWSVTGARINQGGYLEFDITGVGYPGSVEIDPGHDIVNDALGITDDTPDEEANSLLADMINGVNENPENLPGEIYQYIADELEGKYDPSQAEERNNMDKFDAARDAEHDDYY